MASGFFALFDDIASLMDDVATMGKVTIKKTTGILGDDLAMQSDQASGVVSDRELPVIWEIMKGSFLNKAIILPLAFLLSIYLAKLIIILLLLGGAYLGYEGFEKIVEWLKKKKNKRHISNINEIPQKKEIVFSEKDKIRSAIKTDFVLSLEVIIVSLGVVKDMDIVSRILIVSFVALITTIGIYAIVALIIRLDDIGYKIKYYAKTDSFRKFGDLLVKSLPKVIRTLTIVGTFAMLMVAGGIYHHNLSFFHYIHIKFPSAILEIFLGLLIGGLTYSIIKVAKLLIRII